METLPRATNGTDMVFYRLKYRNGESEVFFQNLYMIHIHMRGKQKNEFEAWSYTATFEPVEGGSSE
jgi:hypothetical protein